MSKAVIPSVLHLSQHHRHLDTHKGEVIMDSAVLKRRYQYEEVPSPGILKILNANPLSEKSRDPAPSSLSEQKNSKLTLPNPPNMYQIVPDLEEVAELPKSPRFWAAVCIEEKMLEKGEQAEPQIVVGFLGLIECQEGNVVILDNQSGPLADTPGVRTYIWPLESWTLDRNAEDAANGMKDVFYKMLGQELAKFVEGMPDLPPSVTRFIRSLPSGPST
ncbi:hypothetical protein BDV25DRAFT_153981 [Aspergillus avenaceus]|uniref:Uncharacterized protein n=1 Tax=Aspergillus avenaceus TaxID=36643 RepID=A0A5N6TWB9_ASPAV|nr:hypothetical protein BDV25DRAFT_153981 [Aspergillus avenaceus]